MAPSISFDHITKRYRIGQWLPSLRDALSNNQSKTAENFHLAVNDVSFALAGCRRDSIG